MRNPIFFLVFCVACATAVSARAALPAPEDGPPALLNLDQIIQGTRVLDEAFDPSRNSFFIHYIEEHHNVDSSGNLTPNEDYWTEIENARKGKLAYTHLKRKSATNKTPYEEWYVWKNDLTQQRVFNSINIYGYLIPQAYQFFRYTENIHANAIRLLEFKNKGQEEFAYGAKGPGDDPESLWFPEILTEFRRETRIRPRLEKVGDSWCHVVEWLEGLTFWIDHEHGYLPVKMVGEDAGGIHIMVLNTKLSEARPGLWLPKRQEVQIYTRDEKTKTNLLTRKDFTRLLKIEFNHLDDSFFHLPINDQEIVNVADTVRKMQYFKYPKGKDPMDTAVAQIMDGVESGHTRTWLLANGIVVGMIGLFYLRAVSKSTTAARG